MLYDILFDNSLLLFSLFYWTCGKPTKKFAINLITRNSFLSPSLIAVKSDSAQLWLRPNRNQVNLSSSKIFIIYSELAMIRKWVLKCSIFSSLSYLKFIIAGENCVLQGSNHRTDLLIEFWPLYVSYSYHCSEHIQNRIVLFYVMSYLRINSKLKRNEKLRWKQLSTQRFNIVRLQKLDWV